MQFDRTAIRIRERGVHETLDLALHVMARWWWPLWRSFFKAVLPLMIINALLMEWVFARVDMETLSSLEILGVCYRYGMNMGLLVLLEAPLASLFMVPLLGQLVFEPDADRRTAMRGLGPAAGRFLTICLVWRAVGLGILCMALAWLGVPDYYSWWEFGLLAVVGVAWLVRLARPYVPEVVLLERLGWQRGSHDRTNLRQRLKSLHRWSTGENIARGLLLAFISVGLVIAFMGLALWVSDMLFLPGVVDPAIMRWGWPLALWMTIFFTTIVRFLNYLDLRVRSEGWEIELELRAEAARLQQEVL